MSMRKDMLDLWLGTHLRVFPCPPCLLCGRPGIQIHEQPVGEGLWHLASCACCRAEFLLLIYEYDDGVEVVEVHEQVPRLEGA